MLRSTYSGLLEPQASCIFRILSIAAGLYSACGEEGMHAYRYLVAYRCFQISYELLSAILTHTQYILCLFEEFFRVPHLQPSVFGRLCLFVIRGLQFVPQLLLRPTARCHAIIVANDNKIAPPSQSYLPRLTQKRARRGMIAIRKIVCSLCFRSWSDADQEADECETTGNKAVVSTTDTSTTTPTPTAVSITCTLYIAQA